MARLAQGDVHGLSKKLAGDASPQVRREVAIALRGLTGERADRLWADLAASHTAGDRWELEALGIGADSPQGFTAASPWDGRLAAWLEKVGAGWTSPAGREIVWRSRAAATPRMLCELIGCEGSGSDAISTSESLALLRALDFQDQAATTAAVQELVGRFVAADEKLRVILPELVSRLDATAASEPAIAKRIEEAVGFVAGTPQFVDLVGRFRLQSRMADLVTLACDPATSEQLASSAVRTALGIGDGGTLRAAVLDADQPTAARLLTAVGIAGTPRAIELLEGLLPAAEVRPEVKSAAVMALGRSQRGAERLVDLAKAGSLTGTLPQAAAAAIALGSWPQVKEAAQGVLPMPQPKGGGSLPSIDTLAKRSGGDPNRGKAVFTGAGTCARCHVVGSEGKAMGPNLSEIGAKLSRIALYESILAPSAAISHNYETYTALLDDGRSLTGLLVSESPTEVVIRGADGIDTTTPAGEIDELVKQPISLMPADLAAALSVQELVDLVAWLETLKAQ
jgi:putative heme-binding domain-containing protein